jgi:hypothetical protein
MSTALPQLAPQLELADLLVAGRATMFEPHDLPGRYGRAICAIERLLAAAGAPAVVAGGWAVWRHGFVGRVTQDVDIVVPADHVNELLRIAPVGGFDVLPRPAGLWPKLRHKGSRTPARQPRPGRRDPRAPRRRASSLRHAPGRIAGSGR